MNRVPFSNPHHQSSLTIDEQLYGPGHPDTAQSRWWMVTLAVRQGKWQEANFVCAQRSYFRGHRRIVSILALATLAALQAALENGNVVV